VAHEGTKHTLSSHVLGFFRHALISWLLLDQVLVCCWSYRPHGSVSCCPNLSITRSLSCYRGPRSSSSYASLATLENISSRFDAIIVLNNFLGGLHSFKLRSYHLRTRRRPFLCQLLVRCPSSLGIAWYSPSAGCLSSCRAFRRSPSCQIRSAILRAWPYQALIR
jgi:hypothetical protein